MEAFSLLKFWRIAAGDDIAGASVSGADSETDEEDSFFDLEFTVPGCDNKEQNNSSDSDGDSTDTMNRSNFIESPNDMKPNSKPQSPISFLRSPPKLRVFMLFRNSKSGKAEATEKCTVEEVPIFSLLARENSSRKSFQKQSSGYASSKRFPKIVVQKYLKLIKPLYARASKRYADNQSFSDKFSTPSSSPAPAPESSPRKQVAERQGSRQPPLRVVCKRLGKSRSASAAAGTSPAPARRDDSLLQQHDGIQSAILHCKRSYNSSREFPVLSRSTSNPYHEISVNPSRTSIEEVKTRTSI
ncbi:Membrane-associated kinase regulator 5 [Actinidia chinensis var. chinensis]|uniref:Membrane-associated kinase regulator 5 n=1 Tax=Actinidia chinensis var. chinensis TaxID=1590841 RepID=A0A2R6RW69_ACTCC|nr:Membrane-associated kinase regulator 5 [Actinidia chinensis var. chinensis]